MTMHRKTSELSKMKSAKNAPKSEPITRGHRLSQSDLAKVTGGVPVPSGSSGDSGSTTTK
jgi:hypothetical protein